MSQRIQQKLRIFTGLSLGLIMLGLCCVPAGTTAHAKESPATLSHEKLQNLAQSFVSRIGGKLRAHEAKTSKENSADQGLSLVPDGELLLLRPRTDKFVMDSEIGAIKQGPIMYFSLRDIIGQLELPVEYNAEKGTGSGWFLREDWLIRFDLRKNEVVSRGQTYTITPTDIYMDGDDVFISQTALKTWLEIEAEPDIAQQYLGIRTPYPYPAFARNYRQREVDGRRQTSTPTLPRLKQEEEMFDINVLETQQTVRVRRSPDRPTTTTTQNVTAVSGEALKHNAYAVTSWDNENQLNSVRARLSKESEDPELLGPLKARSYTLGDTDLPSLPLTGNASQELGFRINNNPLRNADFQRTSISGDSLPGWDVELYRDGFIIARTRVEDSARYEFPEVELYAGDNLFEVMFFGPQGEIRREQFNIPVTEAFLATQDNTYDVSLSMNNAQTYLKETGDDEDDNTPHLIARYNKMLGNTLTYAGVRARQEDGEQKVYFGTGFTDVWNGFVFDGNVALDEQANTGAELGARKTIDNWRLSLLGRTFSEDFASEGQSSGKYDVLATANKNFLTPFNTNLSFSSSAQYQTRYDDSATTTLRSGLSHQMGRFNVSNTTSYLKTELGGAQQNPDDRVDNTLAARMNFGKFYTSAGVNYNITPDAQVEDYFGQLSYRPTNRLSSDLYLEHEPNTKKSEARLNVNYSGNKFRVTPFLNVNSDHDVQTGVRLSTALIDQPGSNLPVMTGRKVMGRGLVSSFVFHDKNGNGIYDGDDEPLQDVVIEASNVSRREATNDKGYSLIKDLPESYVTDIRVQQASLPDPFMISGFAGVSVFPKAGQMINLSFPIHIAGEIDGFVYLMKDKSKTEANSIPLRLYPIDGKSTEILSSNTAADGYYVFSSIPPGEYLLAPDADQARRVGGGGVAPVFVSIGYDGTVLAGKDMTLHSGKVQTPIEYKIYKGTQYDKPFFALKVGSVAKSGLAMVLEKIISSRTTNLQRDLAVFPLDEDQNLKYLPGKGLMDHYDRCQTLNDNLVPCEIILYIPGKPDPSIKTAQK